MGGGGEQGSDRQQTNAPPATKPLKTHRDLQHVGALVQALDDWVRLWLTQDRGKGEMVGDRKLGLIADDQEPAASADDRLLQHLAVALVDVSKIESRGSDGSEPRA